MNRRSSTLRQTVLVLLAIAVGLGVVVFGGRSHGPGDDAPYFPPWYLDPNSPTPPEALGPNVPYTFEELDRPDPQTGSRCREGDRTRAFVLQGDRLVWTGGSDELVATAGGRETKGIRGPLWALPVAGLLTRWPGTETVELWPCRGEVRRFEARDLEAAPDRWLLVLTPKGLLKLVDAEADPRRPVLRALAALRLLP